MEIKRCAECGEQPQHSLAAYQQFLAMGNNSSSTSTSGASAADLADHQSKMQEIEKKDSAIRTKYDIGMQYSLKIILCGVRQAGKTSLFNRLQGLGFNPAYKATPQIQIASINWQMKNSADSVKAEVWDVVDQGFTPSAEDTAAATATTSSAALLSPPSVIDKKLSEVTKSDAASAAKKGQTQFGILDSSVVDVYKGANAALFMANPTDRASFDYIVERYKDVPIDIPLLLLLGMKDIKPKLAKPATKSTSPAGSRQGSKSNSSSNLAADSEDAEAAEIATASTDAESSESPLPPSHPVTLEMLRGLCADIVAFRRTAREQATTTASKLSALLLTNEGIVHCFEISCKNCYGLKELYHSFSIPFLHLKRTTLLQQVGIITEQMDGYAKSLYEQVAANSYSAYEEQYEAKLQERAEAARRAQLKAEGAVGDVGSSSEEELSLPPVRGDRYQKHRRSDGPTESQKGSHLTLKLSHSGPVQPRDNMNGFLSDSDDGERAPRASVRKEEPKKKTTAAAVMKSSSKSKNKYFADTSSSSDEAPSPRSSKDSIKRLSGGLTRVAGKARAGAVSPAPAAKSGGGVAAAMSYDSEYEPAPRAAAASVAPARATSDSGHHMDDGLDDFAPEAAEPVFDEGDIEPVPSVVSARTKNSAPVDSDSDEGFGRLPPGLDFDDDGDNYVPTKTASPPRRATAAEPAPPTGLELSAAAQAAIAAAMGGFSGEQAPIKKDKKAKKKEKKVKKVKKKPAEQDFYDLDSGSGVDF